MSRIIAVLPGYAVGKDEEIITANLKKFYKTSLDMTAQHKCKTIVSLTSILIPI